MKKVYDCAQMGHIWLENDDTIFIRHTGRKGQLVRVYCKYCSATTELQANARFTAPPTTGPTQMSGNETV